MNQLSLRFVRLYLFACILGNRSIVAQELVIETDFEGGSARVVEVDHTRGFIRIMPGGDTERGWPAWWCCRIQGLVEGQLLELSVVPSTSSLPSGRPGEGKPLSANWALPDRAAWSIDGEHWHQTAPGERDEVGMNYHLSATHQQLWVAWGPLATPTITEKWLTDTADASDFVDLFELARSREGRTVRGVRIAAGDSTRELRPVVWLQARQHAWESGSSWVARGVFHWLVSDASDAIWLRENALIFVVPIMDVDRVATGDGGKEAVPHDHNRDWSDAPHYPEVAAVQKRVMDWSAMNRMAVFVDLHNPGPGEEDAYFFVAPDEVSDDVNLPLQDRFLDSIQATWTAPIKFDREPHRTGPSYHPLWHRMSSTWVTTHSNRDTIAVCLETSWNTPHSHTAGYASVGASLAAGISRFLQERTDHSESP